MLPLAEGQAQRSCLFLKSGEARRAAHQARQEGREQKSQADGEEARPARRPGPQEPLTQGGRDRHHQGAAGGDAQAPQAREKVKWDCWDSWD